MSDILDMDISNNNNNNNNNNSITDHLESSIGESTSDDSNNYEKYLYPTYEDEDFNKKIFQKKEFNDLMVKESPLIKNSNEFIDKCNETTSTEEDKMFKLSNYQRFVRNYLSFQTPYNSLLLYHGLGTGKTCSSILIAEEMRQYIRLLGMSTRRIIYVVSNDNVQKNFMAQLFSSNKIHWIDNKLTMATCIGDKIIKEFFEHIKKPNYYDDQDVEQRENVKRKFISYYEDNIKPAYHFMNYGKIPSDKYKLYANKLFIIDEVHNIKDKGNVSNDTPKKPKLKKSEVYTINVDGNRYADCEFIVKNKSTDTYGKNTYRFKTSDGTFLDVGINSIIFETTESRSKKLQNFIRNVDNLKLLFLSATPMFDNYQEIATIINFMRMNDNRHPISAEDISNNIPEYARGYVSFVPGGNPYTFPFRLYPLQFAPQNSSQNVLTVSSSFSLPLDLYMDKMNKDQYDIYRNVVNSTHSNDDDVDDEDDDDDGYSEDISHVSLKSVSLDTNNKISVKQFSEISTALIITYPSNNIDGKASDRIGEKASDRIGEKGLNSVCDKSESTSGNLTTYTMKEDQKEFFGKTSLEKYGCKIAAIMEQVDKTEGIILVYSQYITGALIPLALALETIGYIRTTNGTNSTPLLLKSKTKNKNKNKDGERKYALFTGDDAYTSMNDKDKLMEKIKDDDNSTGKRIKVVLISSTASEGIDFKNIRQVHILNPWYNMSRIEQIIGRAVRTHSHQKLDFNKRNVEIYMHCAYYKDTNEANEEVTQTNDEVTQTNDIIVYTEAFRKSKEIGKISRQLKESSIDCLINKDDNDILVQGDVVVRQSPVSLKGTEVQVEVKNMPYSMNCDYMKTCKPITCKTEINGNDVDESTFNESFILMNNDEIISKIKDLFLYRTYYDRNALYSEIRSIFNYSDAQIDVSLSEVIDNKYKYLIYNKVAEEHGYIVNIGTYYMFQPAVLTYPKIGDFERRTKIPNSKLFVSKKAIDNSRLYVDIKELCVDYSKDVLSKLLFKTETTPNNVIGINNDDVINDIFTKYNDDDENFVVKYKVDLLLEFMKIKKRIDEVESSIKQNHDKNNETEEPLKSKNNKLKSKLKSKPKKTKGTRNKPQSYYEFVVHNISDNRTSSEGERATSSNNYKDNEENMKKTIIQNYIDELSYDSQLGLIRYWYAANKNKDWNHYVFKKNNENKYENEYVGYINEYIKKNIITIKNTTDTYLVLKKNASSTVKKKSELKENTIIMYLLNENDIFQKSDNPCSTSMQREITHTHISFYDYIRGSQTKVFKIKDMNDPDTTGEYCGTIKIENTKPFLGEKEIKKGKSSTKKIDICYEIEYNARMNRLRNIPNMEPTILYFSEYAMYACPNHKIDDAKEG